MIQIQTRRETAALLLSDALALFIPLFLGVFWMIYYVNPDVAVLLLRPAVFGTSILLILLHKRQPVTQAERQLAIVVFVFSASLLIPSLTATITTRGLSDWAKETMLCLLTLIFCRILRDQRTTRLMAYSLIASACLVTLFILVVYLQRMGLTLPTYKSSREFKGFVEKVLPLNAVSFASVFAYVLGMLVVRTRPVLLLLGGLLVLASSAFTGSRTPIAVLVLSGILVLLFRWIHSHNMLTRIAAWLLMIAGPISAVALILHLPFKVMSKVTEGRWDLWSVALQKFTESPILGFGYESWRDDLVSRLPGEYDLTLQLARNVAGGYHNEYLTMLAEQGLLGFLGAMTLLSFLLYSSWRLAFFRWNTWHKGAWALFGCIFLLARAGVEMPGLLGYAQEPADYLAYLFLAMVVSRFSVEEDFLRLTHSQQASPIMRLAA